MSLFFWNDGKFRAWVLSRPFEELKAEYWEREKALSEVRKRDIDPIYRYRAVVDAHDSAIVYITALEAALEKAQTPRKGDTIRVTPEVITWFRQCSAAEHHIDTWLQREVATLESADDTGWLAGNGLLTAFIPHKVVKAARAAYIEQYT